MGFDLEILLNWCLDIFVIFDTTVIFHFGLYTFTILDTILSFQIVDCLVSFFMLASGVGDTISNYDDD